MLLNYQANCGADGSCSRSRIGRIGGSGNVGRSLSLLWCVCMPCTLDWHSPHRHSHAFSALKCWPELSEFIVFQASFFLSFLLIQTVHSRTTPAGRKSSSQPFVFTRFHSLLFKFDLIASAVPSRRCWRWPKNSHLIFTLAYQRLPRQCLCFTPVGFI